MSLSEIFEEPHSAGPFKILTVCTGNICRSPLAEGLLRKVLRGLPIEVSSAGTGALVGHSMPDPQLQIAADLGVDDAAQHRARQITVEMLEEADLVLALAREHRRAIAEMHPRASRKTFTLREFARIAESISSEEIDELRDRALGLRRISELAGQLRGSVVPPEVLEDDDVVDPYQQPPDVYQKSARELIPAVNSTVALLRRAAGVR